jgi:hypothetical protein
MSEASVSAHIQQFVSESNRHYAEKNFLNALAKAEKAYSL